MLLTPPEAAPGPPPDRAARVGCGSSWPTTRCCCARAWSACSPRTVTRWWPRSVMAPPWSRRCSGTARTCRSSTCGCRRPTPTRACAPRSPPARTCPAPPCWCSASMWRRPTPRDLLADGSGAVGYLLKDRVARVGEFLDALDRVARGATVLDPQVIAQLLAGQRRDNALETLTARERQLLALMAEGHSNTAIAQRLVHLRQRGGKTHQQRLRQARPAARRRPAPPGARRPRLPQGLLARSAGRRGRRRLPPRSAGNKGVCSTGCACTRRSGRICHSSMPSSALGSCRSNSGMVPGWWAGGRPRMAAW